VAATFTCTSPPHVELRKWHSATLLRSGKVLIAGGWTGDSNVAPVDDAELVDPPSGAFTAVRKPMSKRRFMHGATLLGDSGNVLLAGGARFDPTTSPPTRPEALSSAELYDPVADTFTSVGSMKSGRAFPLMTLLDGGKVLAAGGGGSLFAGQFFLQA